MSTGRESYVFFNSLQAFWPGMQSNKKRERKKKKKEEKKNKQT